ncbi:ankyrin repeat domain-containing protein, partial [archaeon]
AGMLPAGATGALAISHSGTLSPTGTAVVHFSGPTSPAASMSDSSALVSPSGSLPQSRQRRRSSIQQLLSASTWTNAFARGGTTARRGSASTAMASPLASASEASHVRAGSANTAQQQDSGALDNSTASETGQGANSVSESGVGERHRREPSSPHTLAAAAADAGDGIPSRRQSHSHGPSWTSTGPTSADFVPQPPAPADVRGGGLGTLRLAASFETDASGVSSLAALPLSPGTTMSRTQFAAARRSFVGGIHDDDLFSSAADSHAGGRDSYFGGEGALIPYIAPDKLFYIVAYGTAADVENTLLRYGDASVDVIVEPQGINALHLAIRRGVPDMVRALLQHGANPNTPTVSGCT